MSDQEFIQVPITAVKHSYVPGLDTDPRSPRVADCALDLPYTLGIPNPISKTRQCLQLYRIQAGFSSGFGDLNLP
ncbi:hypothetical protein CHU98_g10563 [Xylaria longipes]|nr:hypothetical protein CHU98_g10563 [Xylaria longipes]